MVNFTSNTYQMKREILTFSNKISKHLSKPDKKFTADMTYVRYVTIRRATLRYMKRIIKKM